MWAPPLIKGLGVHMLGLPDIALTIVLATLAAFATFIALFAPPGVKAVVAAWMIAP
jgi:hypothetical protein